MRVSMSRLAEIICERNAGEFDKASPVRADDLPLLGSCRRSDDEVVGAARRSFAPNVCQ